MAPIGQWLKLLTSNRVYLGSNLVSARTIFTSVKNARHLNKSREFQRETTSVNNFPRKITIKRMLFIVIANDQDRVWHLKMKNDKLNFMDRFSCLYQLVRRLAIQWLDWPQDGRFVSIVYEKYSPSKFKIIQLFRFPQKWLPVFRTYAIRWRVVSI